VRIKLLIASREADYSEHLSDYISKNHADVIAVSVCQSPERISDLLRAQRFDAAVLEAPFAEGADLSRITLPLLLTTEDQDLPEALGRVKRISKYQRISALVADVVEQFAKVSTDARGSGQERAQITAVWSPAGGVGKTTVALAYATKKHLEGKQALYLDLEPFSSVPAYFDESGKSISAAFEMLDNNEGNIKILIRGIRRQDSGGVSYFCHPDNFDDMNVLSVENVSALVSACAGVTDELVVDMSCVCDDRTRQVFDLADKVLLVVDQTSVAHFKLSQFTSQHDAFESISEKTVLVANKDATVSGQAVGAVAFLPLVPSADPSVVYRALSSYSFGA